MLKKKLIIAFTFLSGFGILSAQTEKIQNLPGYTSEVLNFGFYIGVNRTNFILHPVNFPIDTILVVESTPKFGFDLGIIAEVALHQYFTVRLVPELAFGERSIQYTFYSTSGKKYSIPKRVESTFINFPLDLKYRSKRINNWGVYVLGGGRYSVDLASQKDVKSNIPGQEIVKLNRKDWGYEGGVGIDFYLPFFKFGIEAKLTVGLKDLLIKDNTAFSNSINKLNSKIFLISFTFEG